MQNEYYVYKHTSPCGKVYIGITRQTPSKRWHRGEGYKGCTYFYHAIHKYGWDNFTHEIICESLSKTEAEHMEQDLIAFYRSNDPEYGYNLMSGGGVHSTHSEETRQKISEAMLGKTNHKGHHHTQEVKDIVGRAHAKPVIQYDLNGNFIAKWPSMTEVERNTGYSKSAISHCVKGKTRTAYGYIWKNAIEIVSDKQEILGV